MNDAGPRRGSSFGPKKALGGTPRFAILLGVITVALATIVLGVSIYAFLEAREPVDPDALGLTPPGNGFRGARVFVRAGCGDCHTLATAAAAGTRGPNLDRHFASHPHSFAFVVARIASGGNGMPAYRTRLSEQEIRDVTTFVMNVAGGPGTTP